MYQKVQSWQLIICFSFFLSDTYIDNATTIKAGIIYNRNFLNSCFCISHFVKTIRTITATISSSTNLSKVVNFSGSIVIIKKTNLKVSFYAITKQGMKLTSYTINRRNPFYFTSGFKLLKIRFYFFPILISRSLMLAAGATIPNSCFGFSRFSFCILFDICIKYFN